MRAVSESGPLWGCLCGSQETGCTCSAAEYVAEHASGSSELRAADLDHGCRGGLDAGVGGSRGLAGEAGRLGHPRRVPCRDFRTDATGRFAGRRRSVDDVAVGQPSGVESGPISGPASGSLILPQRSHSRYWAPCSSSFRSQWWFPNLHSHDFAMPRLCAAWPPVSRPPVALRHWLGQPLGLRHLPAIVIKQAAGRVGCQALHAVSVAQAIGAALPSELIRHYSTFCTASGGHYPWARRNRRIGADQGCYLAPPHSDS